MASKFVHVSNIYVELGIALNKTQVLMFLFHYYHFLVLIYSN